MLTDLRCRQAKAAPKDYKLADAGGLYLFVTTKGFRSWRSKYRFAGKDKRLTFGGYPEVSLMRARALRDAGRARLRDGCDPGVERKQRSAEQALAADATFRSVALLWHAAQTPTLNARYAAQLLKRFENHVFLTLGALPIDQLTPALVLQVTWRLEAGESFETAHRIRQHISDVFVFAIASGWARTNPAMVIRKALAPTRPRLRPAVTTISEARRVLARTEAQPADAVTKLAARFLG